MINSINNISSFKIQKSQNIAFKKVSANENSAGVKNVSFPSEVDRAYLQEEINLKDLNNLFKKIENKKGEDFINTAYQELVKIMDLEGMAPKEITWEKNEGRPIVGDYKFYNNTIVLYKDYFKKLDKATQIGILAHELTHCKQLCNMLSTEGISVEKIANAYAVSDLKAMLITNEKVKKMYSQAKSNGKEKEFLSYMTMVGTQKTKKELEEAHSETLKMPKHPLNSKQGQKAQFDLVAQYNYNGADMKVYNACPLEKEAMKIEKMVINSYKMYKK